MASDSKMSITLAVTDLKKVAVKTSPISALIPKIKQIGNAAVDSRMEFQRAAFVETVHICIEHPRLCQDVNNYAKSLVLEKNRCAVYREDTIPDVGTLNTYNLEWIALYVAKKLGITAEAVGKAKASDSKITLYIFQALLRASGGTRVLEYCGCPEVMASCCDARIAEVGVRGGILTKPFPIISVSGAIGWRAGIYCSKKSDNITITHIVHRPTGDEAEVDAELGIDDTWQLADNHDDMGCMIYKNAVQKQKCRLLFAAKNGPHKVKQWKGAAVEFQELATAALEDTVASKVSAEQAMHTQGMKKKALHSPTKDEQAKRLAKGRELLVQRQAEAAEKRRCKM